MKCERILGRGEALLNTKSLGTLIFILSQGIDFSKERKLGWVDKTVGRNSESRDTVGSNQCTVNLKLIIKFFKK